MQYNPEEMDEILNIFSSESEEIIQELNDGFLMLEKNPEDKTPLKKLFQLSHSLKGAARMIGFNSIQNIAHKLEDILTYWESEDVKINPDMFQEIYNVCDFLLMLVKNSVKQKSDYVNKDVTLFINKLDNFITYNRMSETKEELQKKDEYLSDKTFDINAIILELMFILEMDDKEQNIEEVITVAGENLKSLEEIFNITEYDEIKNIINELLEYIKLKNVSDFDIKVFKLKVLELRNKIYNLYKILNIKLNINKINIGRKQYKIETQEKAVQNSEQKYNKEFKEDFDYILNNFQKIKFNEEIKKEIQNRISKIISLNMKNKGEELLKKIENILSETIKNKIIIDNECYLVLLQSISIARDIYFNKVRSDEIKAISLLERLNLVEEIFNPEKEENNSIIPAAKKSIIPKEDYIKIKKGNSIYDLDEIKVLRVDTSKIDNLIGQTGELLINGIKTREHLIRLGEINSKIVKWTTVSKRILNYLKYLEKRGFFIQEQNENVLAFYKKSQNFFTENFEMVNDLSIECNQLYNMISEDDNKLHQTVHEIEGIAKGIRVLPLAAIFHSFPRMVRDIAKEKNKKTDFIISGSDTTVDKKIIEDIKMPLIHILRNSVSHGIETAEERLKLGKKETGLIKLTAKQAENYVVITIEDDGNGINAEKIKQTAIKKGILSKEETEDMTEEQLMRLLFIPGFSTDEYVSDISGRGIGLDVVKTKITNLNGEISINSELNKGCKVTIKVPVSLSTIKAFILTVNNQKYAIPVNSIKYVKQINKEDIYNKNGRNCITYGGKSIPVFLMSEIFNEKFNIENNENTYTIIIIENQGRQAGYIADKLLGDYEVFQKKFVPPIIKIKNISGFTTLSTGEICLIINPFELVRNTVVSNNISNFVLTDNSETEDKKSILRNKKLIILNDINKTLDILKRDLTGEFQYIMEFTGINSVYDYIQKNETDIMICKINDIEEDVIRLIRYIKSDENYHNIKIVILSDIPEYEINETLRDYHYNLYLKYSEYDKDKLIEELSLI